MEDLDKLRCMKCGDYKSIKNGNFYASKNIIHGALEKLPVCKECLLELAERNKQDDTYDMDMIKDTLRRIDRPWNAELWKSAIEENKKNDKNIFYLYMKNIAKGMYLSLTWADSDKENTSVPVIMESDEIEVTDELINKWGAGYTQEEYSNFERKYTKLIRSYGEKTAFHTEGLITYIRYRVKEELATAKGEVKEAKEWGQLAAKQAQDAKINVSQLSKSDISGGVDVLSQLYEAVESQVSILPLLPKVLEQPYDDVDLIIWATVNYNRRLEDKDMVSYRDIWNFYDEMLNEYFSQKGYDEEKIEEFKQTRNNVFRDLADVYVEPIYGSEDG